MECKQPNVRTPVDFTGDHLNIQVSRIEGKVWVCLDGESVFRAKGLKRVTLHGETIPLPDDLLQDVKEEEICHLHAEAERQTQAIYVMRKQILKLESDLASCKEGNRLLCGALDGRWV